MSCLKGESKVKKADARFACDKCGAKAKKKDHVCKPVKLEVDKKKSSSDSKKGKK